MATTRAIASSVAITNSRTTSSFLFKRPLPFNSRSICLNNRCGRGKVLISKRLFHCNAIYNPQVKAKEEGLPETLDYSVFFEDNSGKKIGDPVQLPANVISPIAGKYGYGTSLFNRFQKAGYPVQMLIRSFHSKEFYNGALEDGLDVQEKTKRDWHAYRCFGPFCFFDIHEGNESQLNGSGSWENADEVDFILLMYHKLVARYPTLKSSSQLAIISPYRHQVKLFRDRFKDNFGVESQKVASHIYIHFMLLHWLYSIIYEMPVMCKGAMHIIR